MLNFYKVNFGFNTFYHFVNIVVIFNGKISLFTKDNKEENAFIDS